MVIPVCDDPCLPMSRSEPKVSQTEEAELACWNHLSGLGFVAEGVRLPLPSAQHSTVRD